MTAPIRPTRDERSISPADLWDQKVREGWSPDSATKYVASIHGPPPSAPVAAPRDVTAARARPADTHSFGEDVTGAGASVLQGATGGLFDELAAFGAGLAANPLHPLRNFDKLHAEAEAPQRAFAERHPVGDVAGQVGGTLLGGALSGGVSEAAFGPRAVSVAAGKAPLLTRAAQAGKDIATAGGVGAGVGFASGSGGVADRLESAKRGAEFGAGLSAGAKAGGALVRASGVPALVRAIAPRPATEGSAVARALNATGVPLASHEQLAARDLLADFQRSGMSIDDYLARANANPTAPLYDLGPSLPQTTGSPLVRRDPTGDPLVRRARGAQSIPSRGSAQITEFTNARAEARPAAVRDALRSALGVSRENTVTLEQSLKGARSAAAAPKYAAAHAAEALDDPEIQSAFKNRHFADAYETGRRIAEQEGVTLPPLRSTSNIGGETVESFNPISVQGLDYAKQGLDDLIESKMASGNMGRREARALRQKLNDMLERVDEQRPEYAEARRAFREGSQALEGAEAGHDFFRMSGDDLEARWPTMTDAAKQQFRKTALAQVEERLASGTNPAKLLDGINGRKLRIIAQSPEEYDAFERALRGQVQGAANDATIRGGSPTARILAEQADLGANPADVARSALNPGSILSRLAESGVANRLRGMTEARVDALAPYLTAAGPELEPRLLYLKALQEEFARGADRSRLRGARVAGQLGGGATSGTRP